ncbi:actin interacting protein 3-domain-containing protein [Sordaria brevicollis]|uniref:Actin interacting protein 3-domain-containing protein n=1 Tax=Sordaria brevicollis TaxID=83679 RepID=A0AAE0PBM1_SORBR|nr:actin interacting protein 3-domain-containing protein [Sordaria brevicollis]
MMNGPGPGRSMQRRTPAPGTEPGGGGGGGGPPPNIPARSISPAVGMGGHMGPQPGMSRSSAGSNRSVQGPGGGPGNAGGGSTRRNNSSSSSSSVPLSQIERSVTHLLVATKQLLETLTQWSRGNATDTQVSDVYVRLGYEFNMACRAFTAINVDIDDLGNVPELLRSILEATLSQEASAESLEKYLPRIRDIIINLLHGLKRKQQKLRQRQQRDREPSISEEGGHGPSRGSGPSGSGVPTRTTSTSTMGSVNSGLTNMLNEGLESNGYRPDSMREDRHSGPMTASPSRRFPTQRDQSRGSVTSSDQSSMSSNTMQNIPVIAPYPGEDTIPTGPPPPPEINVDNFPPPPPPPKGSQQSALAALQRGGDLERRASRRYSQYQISKLVGAQGGGFQVPMLPVAQHTPIPNRGKEVRESLRAVQTRENSVRHNRNASNQSQRNIGLDSSPVRVPSRVSEEPEPKDSPAFYRADSFNVQTPEDKYPAPSATLNGPLADPMPMGDDVDSPKPAATRPAPAPAAPQHQQKPSIRSATPDKQPPSSFMLENSPPATKELTLFLQYKSKVKKFVLPEGYDDLSIARLQLAFIEKFSWNTQQNGADLPEIYIQDPVSGVRHELEDLSDIKDRTVLVLNVEALDEVKKHIDEGIGSLKTIIEQVKQNVDDQNAAIQRVSERQQETAKDLARMAAAPPTTIMAPSAMNTTTSPRSSSSSVSGASAVANTSKKLNPNQLTEIQSLRRDLAVLRQTYSNFQSEVQGSMTALRNKANNVKTAAAKLSVPDVDGDSGRAYVTKGRKLLNADSDRLVNKVDDLQDLVEDLRKDVVQRGVRPLPRQLEVVTKDITTLTKELKKMEEFMKREKPIWTKIWEKELEDVCQGRDELRLMEDLMVDLRDDLEKASETFSLVEQATKEQMKEGGQGNTVNGSVSNGPTLFGAFSRGLKSISEKSVSADPTEAKEGVLGEVRALQPNHESRLEAIERAEKLRQKELQTRMVNPLTKELASFVEEGKLKKSGGVEEVERARKAKDDRIRKEVWERMNGMMADNGEEDDEDDDDEEEETEDEEEESGEEEEGQEEASAKGSVKGDEMNAEEDKNKENRKSEVKSEAGDEEEKGKEKAEAAKEPGSTA